MQLDVIATANHPGEDGQSLLKLNDAIVDNIDLLLCSEYKRKDLLMTPPQTPEESAKWVNEMLEAGY